MEEVARKTCSHCGKEANNKCARCKIHVYCGKECQKADWPTHKTPCKDIRLDKVVFRAANLLQQIFFTFRLHAFEQAYTSIQQEGDAFIIKEKYLQLRERTGGWLFTDFPDHLVKSQEMKEVMLCAFQCRLPFFVLHNTIAKLFSDLNVHIEEVQVFLKRAPRHVLVTWPDSNTLEGKTSDNSDGRYHAVFLVSSHNGNRSWIIDVTGPQYGISVYHRAEDYERKYIRAVSLAKEFGKYKHHSETTFCDDSYHSVKRKVELQMVQRMDEDVQQWMQASNMTLSGLLRLEDGDFVSHKDALMKVIDNSLHSFIGKASYLAELLVANKWQIQNTALVDQNVRERDTLWRMF